MFLAYKMVYV